MVGERRGSGGFVFRSSLARLTPRLSSPDCTPSIMALQDSSESGDTDILSENEDVGTQIPYDKSRLGSTRSKQLPVPVSVREGESDDLEPLIATHDVSEWTCEEVRSWVVNIFNESIADKFTEQEISGTTLLSQRVLSDDSMEKLGLNTIGKKEKFTSSVQKLQAHGERAPKNVCKLDSRPKGKLNSGKLSLPDIKSLDPATKSIYLTVRTRIRRAAEEEFPGDNIPTFRNNIDAKKRLDKLVNQLAETCCIKEVNFREEGIRSHIMAVLNERRRMVTLGHSYQDKRKSSDSDSEASSPPCSQLKKKKAHNSHGDDTENSTSLQSTEDDISEEGSSTNMDQSSCKNLSVKSAEVITMAVFKETKIKDVKLHKQILPACRFLKVAGVRGKSKPSVTKLLAQAVIDKGYVVVNDSANCNLANLTLGNITVSSDKDMGLDVKEWQKSNES